MRLFIGCGASSLIDEKYLKDCEDLLDELFKNDNDLVFGGSKTGLMGLSYRIAKANNRKVIGVVPDAYMDDFVDLVCDEEMFTRTVNERTNELIRSSDAIIFLPGGLGTIYELFSALELKRGKEFDKPIVIYNSNNYFDEAISCLEKIYKENFSSEEVRKNYFVTNDKNQVLEYINNY